MLITSAHTARKKRAKLLLFFELRKYSIHFFEKKVFLLLKTCIFAKKSVPLYPQNILYHA